MKKKYVTFAGACCIAAMLAACGNTNDSGQTTTAQETVTETETTTESGSESTIAESVSDSSQAESVSSPEQEVVDNLLVWGPVLSVDEERISFDNQSGNSSKGEMILNFSKDHTLLLDAENGFPVSIDTLEKGETIYAYIGPAMTMSLPPITNPNVIICDADNQGKVPAYLTVKESVENEDGSVTLTAVDGSVYEIPESCEIIPYLTRNIVTVDDLTEGRTCLLWADEKNQAQKIVVFSK